MAWCRARDGAPRPCSGSTTNRSSWWSTATSPPRRRDRPRPAHREAGRPDGAHRVVDALASEGTVLPIRFGSVLADRDSVVDELLVARPRPLRHAAGRPRGEASAEPAGEIRPRAVCSRRSCRHIPRSAELRRRTRDLPEERSTPTWSGWASWSPGRWRPGSRTRPLTRPRPASRRGAYSRDPAAGSSTCSTWPCWSTTSGSPSSRTQPRDAGGSGARTHPPAPDGPGRAVRLRGGNGVGLITGILGLPLAPLRGAVAVAEQVLPPGRGGVLRPRGDPQPTRGGRPPARRGADRG